jgi:hypothetical protein
MSLDEKDKKLGETLARLRDGLEGLQPAIEAIDAFLNYLGKPLDPEHPGVYERLNWENRDSEHGPFQMLREDNCNDTQLFNHLDAILKQNKNNVSIGDWHYWAGDPGYIFRRKKKQSKPQAKE